MTTIYFGVAINLQRDEQRGEKSPMVLAVDHALALRAILYGDPLRRHVLGLVQSLGLPDCWIGAGFIRNAVWDHLHGRPASCFSGDVDIIWFHPERTSLSDDRTPEAALKALEPSVYWSVKNQARMHFRNGDAKPG